MSMWKWRTTAKAGVLSSLLIAISVAHAQKLQWLPLTDSSTSGRAYAVDSVSNRVVGTLFLPNGNAYACYWDKIASGWTGPFFLADQPSIARAVDSQGVIAGHTALNAFSYQSSFTLLSNPLGNFPSRALGIAALDNLIVGGVQNTSGDEYPVYWLNGTPQVLRAEQESPMGLVPMAL